MLKITKIKPMFTDLIITAEKFENDTFDNGILVGNKGDLKAYQTVVAIGNAVRDIEVGDKVMVNFDMFAEHKISPNSVKDKMDIDNPVIKWNIPWVVMSDEQGNDRDYIKIPVNAVEFVFEGEEIDSPEIIEVKKPDILVN